MTIFVVGIGMMIPSCLFPFSLCMYDENHEHSDSLEA